MKPHTLPVKRRPVRKSVLKRLSAVTQRRKQQRAAVASADDYPGDHSSKIARALTIIVLIHVVAIGLIIFHQRFLDKNHVEAPKRVAAAATVTSGRVQVQQRQTKLSPEDSTYRVKAGDNYSRIAEQQKVDENELREANNRMDLVPGAILKLPPQRIVAVDPPEVEKIRQAAVSDRDRGLVESQPYDQSETAPRAILVRPNRQLPTVATTTSSASSESYTVKEGDSIWRISNRFKVDQKALMKLNGITDARKLRVGMNLKIPR
ncbi:LysM peptidoglycan-binding domain-containing protein [Luteolibacter pohnpeiensis]|uniref:LysM peptidoglycan-binding domain-containing protein n=1 Tax=Luteolibacter pohnpeiensis TaxID=454153 RepID=A0A934S755_9BACT|nr:LysM peptidoglycan-binding domain-containing protein [Luteolibacter pohnpeiensis]MBK1883457.1 LysM peptidoglycan-binding domain-containing protein [Luteolibacter pohnpeiensis]